MHEYEQKKSKLALGLEAKEDVGTLKRQGRKLSQYEKVSSREKETEPVGKLLKSPKF